MRGANPTLLHWILPLGLLIAVAWVAAACAPATRYRTLAFFFDGVPDPNAPPGSQPGGKVRPAAFHPANPRAPARPTPLPIVSTHKPVVERQCNQCHDASRGLAPIALDARLCDKCHGEQRRREGWSHGPINLGTCIPCHRAHESPYPHLLDKPVPEICMTCHYEDMKIYVPEHFGDNFAQCTDCHDPHRMY